MPNEKLTPSVKAATEQLGAGQDLHVVLELSRVRMTPPPGSSRADMIEANKQDFARVATPIKEVVQRLGGQVTAEAWINSTLAVKLPTTALPELADEGAIASIDLARSLKGDAL